ncbi:MAG TPA: hypothetical protein EYN96_05350 [Candidatus Hydrogenedentes bacterium]|nr:hypothetical protein [Candidatus Hydrogenedentota bacterium]
MVARIESEPTFSISRPEELLPAERLGASAGFTMYDISPDGERLITRDMVDQSRSGNEIVMIENWNHEVDRMTPKDKDF